MNRDSSWLLALLIAVLLGSTTTTATAADGDEVIRQSPSGKQTLLKFENPDDPSKSLEYWLYEPAGAEEGEKLPTMFFLHGAGERHNDKNPAEAVLKHGPPKLIERGEKFPCRVISPQCPPSWWHPNMIIPLVEHTIETYDVDEDRVYLTGLSMGGMASWDTAAMRPDLFAAVVPICGKAYDVPAWAEKLKNTWIWAFHGDKDNAVPVTGTTDMVAAIEAAGGERVKMTIYEGVGHNSWTKAYDDPELYKWMFSKQRDPQEDAEGKSDDDEATAPR